MRDRTGRPHLWRAEWLSHLPAVGAALFALTYGVLRPAYDLFYEPLGLSIDDLGISETRIVGHAAGYAAALALVVGAAAVIGRLTYLGTRSLLRIVNENEWLDKHLLLSTAWLRRIHDRHGRLPVVVIVVIGTIVIIAILACLLLVAAVTLRTLDGGVHGNADAVLGFAALGALIGFLFSIAVGTLGGVSRPARLVRAVTRLLATLSLAGLAMVAATRAFDFWADARQLSVDIITGRGTSDALYVMDWLDVRPTPVMLHLVADEDPAGICDGGSRAYLLGYNDSFIYLLVYPGQEDGEAGRTVRVSDSAYAVSGGLDDPVPCRQA